MDHVQVHTLLLRNTKPDFVLPAALTKLQYLTTFAVCVEEGGKREEVLHRGLQQLRAVGRRVLAYESESPTGKWKAVPIC